MNKQESPVVTSAKLFLDDRRRYYGKQSNLQPGQTFDEAMMATLMNAIHCRLKFAEDDFIKFAKVSGSKAWLTSESREMLYALAVIRKNKTAVAGIERWMGYKPIIIATKRVYIGKEFDWEGKRLTCTGFSEDRSCLIAHDKARKRYTISRTMIWGESADRRKRAKVPSLLAKR